MALQYILMGDVVKSSDYEPRELRREFMGIIAACNKDLKPGIISPYTVTLGDEFQGIAASLRDAVKAIFFLEEARIRESFSFKIRYVIYQGPVETDINQFNAYTMMGEGLTLARKTLTDKRRGMPRFRFHLADEYAMNQLNRLFLVLDGLAGRWDVEDGKLILDMLANTHNEQVGDAHGKNRSQIWKRRKNLLIEEYRALKDAIIDLAR
jgi:hypothetical protein